MTCRTCKYQMTGTTELSVFCGLMGGEKPASFVCGRWA